MKKITGKVTDIDFFSRKSTLPTCPIIRIGSEVAEWLIVSSASRARGPGFDPCQQGGKFVGPNTLFFVSFAGMT